MTTNTDSSGTGQTSRAAGGGIFQTILAILSSAKLATAVGGLVVLACIIGTILPQGGEVAGFIRTRPGWAGFIESAGRVGLTNVFEASWFMAVLVFFAINIAACIFRRMSSSVRSGRMGISGWGFLLTHISMLLILAGAVVRGVVGQKGYLEIGEGQASSTFQTAKGLANMPFEVRLADFSIEYYDEKKGDGDILGIVCADLGIETQAVFKVGETITAFPAGAVPGESNTLRILVSRYVPDFTVNTSTREVISRSNTPRNPAILVKVEGPGLQFEKWVFARFPDFDMTHSPDAKQMAGRVVFRFHSAAAHGDAMGQRRIRSFKSELQLLEGGKVVRQKTIEVNSPLSYGGYTFYQSGYNPEDLTRSTLQIVKDPGVVIVYTGFAFMIGGLVLLLGLKPMARKLSDDVQSPGTEVGS